MGTKYVTHQKLANFKYKGLLKKYVHCGGKRRGSLKSKQKQTRGGWGVKPICTFAL